MTNADFNWPKKGDRLFKPSIAAADQARLEVFVMPSDEAYAAGFQRAANMIVDAALSDGQNPDDLFFPVAYLYRHHLELMLKDLVRLGVRLAALEPCDDILGDHNLHQLWNRAKNLIKQVWPDSPDDDVRAAEHLILELHKMDPTGQAFRYFRDKTGAPYLQGAPERVDLGNLKLAVDSVSRFLVAAYEGIDNCDPGPP
jgi:hypothetical protein